MRLIYSLNTHIWMTDSAPRGLDKFRKDQILARSSLSWLMEVESHGLANCTRAFLTDSSCGGSYMDFRLLSLTLPHDHSTSNTHYYQSALTSQP